MRNKRKPYTPNTDFMAGLIALAIVAIIIASVLLVRSTSTLKFQGERYDVRTLEEVIADMLEAENPGYDIEVNISVEMDD